MKKLSVVYLLFEIVKKDFKIEMRNKANLNQMLIFALATAFLFSLSIDVERFFPYIVILIVLFTSIIGISASILREFDFETIDGLKASPLTNSQIITAKMLSNLVIVLIISALVYSVCYALFNVEGDFLLMLIVVLIAIFPISSTITLLAPLSVGSRGREMVLLGMSFPVIFPILMPATRAITLANAGSFDLISASFILSYTGIIYSLSLLLSDHIF
ncbi:MAG: heme exporter protein CcmB [Archaeoglobaceae archaeon]|nr:heme exporter protein CcmB [Archaeoglobaceae archaeon]